MTRVVQPLSLPAPECSSSICSTILLNALVDILSYRFANEKLSRGWVSWADVLFLIFVLKPPAPRLIETLLSIISPWTTNILWCAYSSCVCMFNSQPESHLSGK